MMNLHGMEVAAREHRESLVRQAALARLATRPVGLRRRTGFLLARFAARVGGFELVVNGDYDYARDDRLSG